MAADDEKNNDFYAVMGLKKECTPAELRNAYMKLAKKWHPDRCSASGNSEEAKKKFQDIQQAYSVLSDGNKRFLYDVGVYDCNDDDDENGMGDFLNEMATMMSQNKSNENSNESFEDLQQLFEEIFCSESDAFTSSSCSTTPSTCLSSQDSCRETYNSISNKRNSSSDMSPTNLSIESTHFGEFSIGVGRQENTRLGRVAGERTQRQAKGVKMRDEKRQKMSTNQGVAFVQCYDLQHLV